LETGVRGFFVGIMLAAAGLAALGAELAAAPSLIITITLRTYS
jgi:hypothetical protein